MTANETAKWIGLWLVAAAALFGAAVYLVPQDQIPTYAIALGVVLILPLARIALAPLALAWNRHR